MPEHGPRRHLGKLVADTFCYWLANKMRARSRNHDDFQHIAVPINDLIGIRVFATGQFELTQFDAVKALLASSDSILGVPINRQGAFIDVGANIGLYTIAFSRMFGRTIAFEANPATFKILEANVALSRLDRVQRLCLGLSDEARDGIIYVPEDGNLGWATLTPRSGIEPPTMEIAIKLDTLDNLAESLGLEAYPVSLIKIDVEGHELPVLHGASKLLMRWGPIVLFEALNDSIGGQCVGVLKDCGYSRFYRFRRAFDWRKGGLKGCLADLVLGLPVRYEEIDTAAGVHAPLVCAVRV